MNKSSLLLLIIFCLASPAWATNYGATASQLKKDVKKIQQNQAAKTQSLINSIRQTTPKIEEPKSHTAPDYHSVAPNARQQSLQSTPQPAPTDSNSSFTGFDNTKKTDDSGWDEHF